MKIKNQYAKYAIMYSPRAEKALKKLDNKLSDKIKDKIHQLVKDQQNLDISKLQGTKGSYYRLRVGNYRVLFVPSHSKTVLVILEIGPRENFYRN